MYIYVYIYIHVYIYVYIYTLYHRYICRKSKCTVNTSTHTSDCGYSTDTISR